MKRTTNRGFTLVEILIVVVIMAVLAATIIPQFSDSTKDAKESTGKHNLAGMRAQLQIYRVQHDGEYPTTLGKMTKKTNIDHTEASGTLGPYMLEVPGDGVTSSNAVATSSAEPIAVTGTTGGWVYNSTTGEIRINHEDYDDL
jgi:prepilin-type N-terminal cleavage/methylation domain-containing protein